MCLIALVPGSSEKSIPKLIKSIQDNKPKTPKVETDGHREHNKCICFNFITDQKGCRNSRGQRACHFAHLDISKDEDKQLPRQLWQDLQQLLAHPTISPHHVPTSQFVDFLAALT